MKHIGSFTILLLFLLAGYKVASTPLVKGEENQAQDEEQQLDQLRLISETSTNNIGDQSKQDTAAGPRQKKSHIFKEHNNPLRQYKRNSLAKFSGIQYTPEDLAQYIFRTGDEEGVALAVEELLREKMLNRQEAISYLQEVKNFINEMKTNKKNVNEKKHQIPKREQDELIHAVRQEQSTTTATPEMSSTHALLPISSSTSTSKLNQEMDQEVEESSPKNSQRTLKEVIYRLAKDMFKYSLDVGDQTAEDSLGKLISFLESEVENKRISPIAKEKILEVVSTALVDSLKEYQKILTYNNKNSVNEYQTQRGLPLNTNEERKNQVKTP